MAIYNKIIHGRCLTNCTTTTVHIADATLWTQAKKNIVLQRPLIIAIIVIIIVIIRSLTAIDLLRELDAYSV